MFDATIEFQHLTDKWLKFIQNHPLSTSNIHIIADFIQTAQEYLADNSNFQNLQKKINEVINTQPKTT